MNTVSRFSRRTLIAVGIAATLILTGLSMLALGVLGGGVTRNDDTLPFGSVCALPNLSGTVVTVNFTDSGAVMDGQHSRMTSGAQMLLSADRETVRRGTVSFVAINSGSVMHELVVLPLPENQDVGARPIGGDGRVSQTGSVGEASAPCGEGAGAGIAPGASSWVRVTLAPGRYELICNLPGHYAAGDYTELTVN